MYNMEAQTVVCHRQICDYVVSCGGVTKVPVTKELLQSAASARSRYRAYLEEEKGKKMTEEQSHKRKLVATELETAKKQRQTLQDICNRLSTDVDKLAEEAEQQRPEKMAELLTRSNALRQKLKEKRAAMKVVNEQIKSKSEELRVI